MYKFFSVTRKLHIGAPFDGSILTEVIPGLNYRHIRHGAFRRVLALRKAWINHCTPIKTVRKILLR